MTEAWVSGLNEERELGGPGEKKGKDGGRGKGEKGDKGDKGVDDTPTSQT
jgi:hypothetical protein